jgi:hypothetical protein
MGEAVGGWVAAGTVGVERSTGVGRSAGALRRESEQALRLNMAIPAAKRIMARFISLSSSAGTIPPASFYHYGLRWEMVKALSKQR